MAAPTNKEVISIIQNVAKKEGCTLPDELAERIAEKSGRNLRYVHILLHILVLEICSNIRLRCRRAILMTQACRVQQYPFTSDQEVAELDWEKYLGETAQQIVLEQTPKKLLEVRGRLYELLTHCIPPDVIFV